MGIIRAALSGIRGGVNDQFNEAVEPVNMGEHTVFAKGLAKGGRKDRGLVTNGSVIHVYENQFMMLMDGGKIIDYSAEPGYFVVDNSSSPSMFNGNIKEIMGAIWDRFKFSGANPRTQEVYYINMAEIPGIRFGTRNPINYFDNFYGAELFLRTHGTYSIRVNNPLLFYAQAVPKTTSHVEIEDINEQYLSEYLEALQAAINQMSVEGTRISFVTSKSAQLSRLLAEKLNEQWTKLRGIEIVSAALASISYDEESQKLINMRNQGAMMSDPTIREGYVQSSIARGIENAGSNAAGASTGFMGVNMGVSAGSFMSSASQTNLQQMQQQQSFSGASPEQSWTCSCGTQNTGNFCSNCGRPKTIRVAAWTCSCGTQNTGNFCSNCGKPRPSEHWTCSCGTVNTGKFCSHCGKPRQ